MKLNDNKASEIHETGEEQLSRLIRQAGEEARAKKKKILALHYKKLKEVIAEGVACRQNNELSEMGQ